MTIGEIISAFFTSSGPGGVVVISVVVIATAVFFQLTRWILAGGKDNDKKIFR